MIKSVSSQNSLDLDFLKFQCIFPLGTSVVVETSRIVETETETETNTTETESETRPVFRARDLECPGPRPRPIVVK